MTAHDGRDPLHPGRDLTEHEVTFLIAKVRADERERVLGTDQLFKAAVAAEGERIARIIEALRDTYDRNDGTDWWALDEAVRIARGGGHDDS